MIDELLKKFGEDNMDIDDELDRKDLIEDGIIEAELVEESTPPIPSIPSNNGLALREELSHWEEIIRSQMQQAFWQIGTALTIIRDKQLYREEYGSFEAYCLERWDFSRPRAYQLIDGAAVMNNLKKQIAAYSHENENVSTTVDRLERVSTIVDNIPLPENERQVRVLAQFEPEKQLDLWLDACRQAPNGNVTSPFLAEVARKRYGTSHTRISSGNTQKRISSSKPVKPPRPADEPAPKTLCAFCGDENLIIYPSQTPNVGICLNCNIEATRELNRLYNEAAQEQFEQGRR